MKIIDLPDDVIESICEQLDVHSRASTRKAHTRFDCVVSKIEDRLITKCRQAGVSLPPRRHREYAVASGYGIDYEKIATFDPFGSNLYKDAWQGPRGLTSTTLPVVRNGQGETVRAQTTGLRPTLAGAYPGRSSGCASAKIELMLTKVGISSWMLVEPIVRLSILIRGVRTVENAYLRVNGELRSQSGDHSSLEVVNRRESVPIEGWGQDVEIMLATSEYHGMDHTESLNFELTFFDDFVLCSVEIFASFVN